MTEGTAKPNAHGHEATNTPIPRSTIQHIAQDCSIITVLDCIRTAQTAIVRRLNITTAFTKMFAIDLQTA